MDIVRAYAARYGGGLDEALSVGRQVLEETHPSDADGRGKILYNQARVHMVLATMAPAGCSLRRASRKACCVA